MTADAAGPARNTPIQAPPIQSTEAAYRRLVDLISDVLEGRGGLDRLSMMMGDVPAIFEAMGAAGFADEGVMLVLDPAGRVLSRNAAAARRLALEVGDELGAVVLTPGSHAAFLETVRRTGEAGALFVADMRERTLLLAGMAPERGGDILLVECRRGQDTALEARLTAVFGLIPSELRVLFALMDGRDIEAIAAETGRKPATIRQLVKAVLAKMGVHSQTQAVALAYSLMLTAERLSDSGPRLHAPSAAALLEPTADGPVPVHRFGRPGGFPVLLLHGALFGIAAQPDIRHAAHTLGLDVIAPVRPGYGAAPLAPGADPLKLAAARIDAILDRQGITRAVVVAHDIGTRFAIDFALRRPDRVAGIVAAPATPPMRGWAQTSDMPLRHRVNAWASQKMPALMDKIVGLGITQVARKGVDLIPGLVFSDCDFDRDLWSDPRFAPSLQESFALVSGQKGLGFRHDMRLTNEDWSDLAPRVTCEVLLLHGERSQTVSRQAVSELAGLLPAGRFQPVGDAGHTLPLSHGDMVFRQALLLAGRAGLSERL